MKRMCFMEISSKDIGEDRKLRFKIPLENCDIPRQGENIWFNESEHGFSGLGNIKQVWHEFFVSQGIQIIFLGIDVSISGNEEDLRQSEKWADINDECWRTDYLVVISE